MNALNLAAELVFAKRALDKPCYLGPGYRLDYRELDRAVRRQAAAMIRDSVTAGDRVVIALDDGPNLAVLFFAALAIGALPAVVNSRLDRESLRTILEDAKPALLYAQVGEAVTVAQALGGLSPAPNARLLETMWFRDTVLAARDDDDRWDATVAVPADAPALIQYTSGTTGKPKGVMHSGAGVLACCADLCAQLRLGQDDVLYSVPKMFFGYGMGNSLFFPLYLGASAVLDPAWPTAESVLGNLREFAPTVLFAVPTLYRMLLEGGLRGEDCKLRLAFSAGAPLPEATAARWRLRFGFDLHDGIGATELCHVFATTYPDALRPGSLGRMLPSCKARIVDEHGRDVGPGQIGVLLVRSPAVAAGYWRRRHEGASRFVDGWYRTGDLFARDDEQYLYFHGREDDRFKVFGRWVVPIQVELLIGTHLPELGICFVVPARDASGEDRPVLCVHGQPGAEQIERVQALMELRVESHMRPVRVLQLDELPLTANGKPNRRAIAQFASRALQPQALEDVSLC
ncbi:AMP-binding protein [Lysobacter enzymogenes]|uniref:AMP-binding protein n=1 Tax=Lysobacter enzymogenes TaxID=69 RepID=UPI001A9634DF|nr:AMP-binding protein [Lysobacter enzymogenes]QQP94975.1 AMP-binding protein [Lysobacter enzymogenes]